MKEESIKSLVKYFCRSGAEIEVVTKLELIEDGEGISTWTSSRSGRVLELLSEGVIISLYDEECDIAFIPFKTIVAIVRKVKEHKEVKR